MNKGKKKESKELLKKKLLDKNTFEEMVNKTFRDADLNKYDFIQKEELAVLLKSIYGTLGLPPPSKSDIDKELKRLDKNGDKKLSKKEFSVLVRDLCLYFIEQSD